MGRSTSPPDVSICFYRDLWALWTFGTNVVFGLTLASGHYIVSLMHGPNVGGAGHKLHVTTNPWSLLGENDEDSYLPIKFTNNLVMHCLYCYGISLTQPLTTWADTSLHFLLLKRSMANPISIICLSLLGLQPPSSLPLSTCMICRCPSP